MRAGPPGDVLTAEILSPLYEHPMHVMPHPLYGYPLILPDGDRSRAVAEGLREEKTTSNGESRPRPGDST